MPTGNAPYSEDMVQLISMLGGDSASSVDALWPLVYDELRRLAADYLISERQDHTLDPTGLVHEAYVRLVNQSDAAWHDRPHFFAVAARVMRRILIDHARAHRAEKRGGGRPKTSLDEAVDCFEQRAVNLVALDDALSRLSEVDARKSRVVELRFFGGLMLEEVAEFLDVSLRTVERDWTMAKAWLRAEIGGQHS